LKIIPLCCLLKGKRGAFFNLDIGFRMGGHNWVAEYRRKLSSAEDALSVLRHGHRIFVGSACGEPQCLTRSLSLRMDGFCDLEIVSLLSLPGSPLDCAFSTSANESLSGRLFCPGYAGDKRAKIPFSSPVNLSSLTRLIKNRLFPINLALIQVSPPDATGRMSLGVSVDITLAAARAAEMVIAQINPRMPITQGEGNLCLDEVAKIVEYEEDILTWENPTQLQVDEAIAGHVARLIDDGSTLHIGQGAMQRSVIKALENKNDLGLHTGFLTDEMIALFKLGVINNLKKTLDTGKMVAAAAMGSKELYGFMNGNPHLEMRSFEYILHPAVVTRQQRMVSVSEVAAVDLTGRISVSFETGSGVTCNLDNLTRGALEAPDGKSIAVLASTSAAGKKSNILKRIQADAVSLPAGDANFVVTEYGAVNLFGKNLNERAVALISIAHPSFRDELLVGAREMGLIKHEPRIKEAICSVYPSCLEEMREIDGKIILFRPAKPSDERLIQEHFYAMDNEDVVARFLHEKPVFSRSDVCCMCRLDYLREITLLAVIGVPGYERIVGVGASFFHPSTQTSEVAFSVLKQWQGKTIGSILIRKLIEFGIKNGAKGIFAFTIPQNQRMIRLFNGLPYRMKKSVVEGMLTLSCQFEDKKEA